MAQPIQIHSHGRSGYKRGCRCEVCTASVREYMREYQRRVKGCKPVTPCAKSCGRGVLAEDPDGLCWYCRRTSPTSERERAAKARRSVARAKLRKAARGKAAPKNWSWCVGTCVRCSETFTRKGQPSPWCSQKCSRADRKKSHGIRARTRREIYERDSLICQICDEPTEPDADPRSDWYPTVDHIVPRSRGGSNEPENLRCAHRWCNSVLGDGSHYTLADLAA